MATIGTLTANLELQSAAFIRGLDRASAALRSQTAQMHRQNQILQRSFDDVRRSVDTVRAGFAALGAGLVVRSIVDATLALERINSTLRAGTGSSEAAAEAFGFVRSEAQRLGLDLQTTAQQFGSLTAAARGTVLQGQATRDIFTAVAEASATLRLSSEQTGGALTAIQQIISKGTVSAEELRGQLGERLPGAFQIAARSIGVTTQELDKMLRKGEVVATDFLPKFAAELHRAFGPQAEQAAQSLQGSINNLNTAFFEFRAQVGAGGVAQAIQSFSDGLNEASKGSAQLARQLGADLGAALRVLGQAALFALEHFKELSAVLAGLLAAKAATLFLNLATAIGVATKAMLTFNAAVRANPIGLIATAIGTAVAALVFYRDEIVKIGELTFRLGTVTTLVWTAIQEVIAGNITIVKSLAGALASLAALDFEGVVKSWQSAVAGFARVFDAPSKAMQEFRKAASEDLLAQLDFSDVIKGAKDLGNAVDLLPPKFNEITEAEEKLGKSLKDARIEEQLSKLPEHVRRLGETLRSAGIEFDVQGKQLEVNVSLGARINKLAIELLEIYKRQNDELAKQKKLVELAAEEARSAGAARETFEALQATVEEQKLLLRFGGEETEEYRVQLKLLQLKREHGAAFAASQEKLVRENERLTTQLKEQEGIEKLLAESVEHALDNIQDAFADTFEEIFSGELRNFEDFGDAIVDIMKRTAAEIAAAMVIRPVIEGITNPATGLIDFSRIRGGLTSTAPLSGAGLLGAGALGFGAGTAIGGRFGGQGATGGGIGGGLGAALGGFFGVPGAIGGGLLGSLLGGFLGGRFGGGGEDTGALRFATGRGSPFDIGAFGSLNISGENSFAGPLREIITKFDEGVSEFLTARQEQMAEQAVQALEQFEGRFPEADPSAGFLAILKERAGAILEAILPDTADIEKIFEGVADIDQLGQRVQVALQAIQTFNELTGKTLTPAQQLEEAVVGVRQQFADLVPILRTLGYSEDQLASARQEAINRTKQAAAAEQQAIALEKQALTLQLQGFIAGNSLQQTLVGIRIQFLQLRQSAIGLGVSLDLVDQAFHAAIAGARAADRANRDAAARARADRIAAAAQQRADNARRRRDEAERRAEERRQRTLDRAGFINQLSVAGRADLSPAQQFAFGLRDINLKYIEAAHRARELGVSLRLVRAARQREIDTLRATTNALKASEKAARELAVAERHVARIRFAIDLRRFLPTTPAQELQLQLRELNLQINEFRKQARAMGFSVEQVNNIWRQAARNLREEFIAELQAGIADLADQAVGLRNRFQSLLDPLLEFQRELQGVGASPAQSFQLAQQDFNRISQLALGGNIAAIEQIDEAGRALLDAAAVFGASPLVADVQQQVADVVGRVIERTTDAQNDAMRGVTGAIERTGRETVTELRQLVSQGRDNAAAIARQDRLLQQIVSNTTGGRRTA